MKMYLSCSCGEELHVRVHTWKGLPATLTSPAEPGGVTDVEVLDKSCACPVDEDDLIEQAEEQIAEKADSDDGDAAYDRYVEDSYTLTF